MLLLQSCQFYNIAKNQFVIEDMSYGIDDFLQCGLEKVRKKSVGIFSSTFPERHSTLRHNCQNDSFNRLVKGGTGDRSGFS